MRNVNNDKLPFNSAGHQGLNDFRHFCDVLTDKRRGPVRRSPVIRAQTTDSICFASQAWRCREIL